MLNMRAGQVTDELNMRAGQVADDGLKQQLLDAGALKEGREGRERGVLLRIG
jgi:hypothetical protein